MQLAPSCPLMLLSAASFKLLGGLHLPLEVLEVSDP